MSGQPIESAEDFGIRRARERSDDGIPAEVYAFAALERDEQWAATPADDYPARLRAELQSSGAASLLSRELWSEVERRAKGAGQ